MDEKLRRLQLVEIDILNHIDWVCKKHDIHYSLYAGTLLGAVRHHGFIPWDDDLDVCMLRSEYDRFLRAWEEERICGYTVQNKDNTPTFTQAFTKIRKDHTTFIQYDWEKGRYHTGIFVDVFPVDRMPSKCISRVRFFINSLQYFLLLREFVPPKANIFVKAGASILLRCIPEGKRTARRKKCLAKIQSCNELEGQNLVVVSCLKALHHVYPPQLFAKTVEKEFEGRMFQCTSAWDTMLHTIYGDYMMLPPENERTWTHHPLVLDFERSYEELEAKDEA